MKGCDFVCPHCEATEELEPEYLPWAEDEDPVEHQCYLCERFSRIEVEVSIKHVIKKPD